MKHTPGPWHIENSGGTVASGLKRICTLENIPLRISPEVEANAQLIAAAPELLDALINLVNIVNELEFSGFDTKGEDPQDWTVQANAVIRKATG